jgi:hypothetical protein
MDYTPFIAADVHHRKCSLQLSVAEDRRYKKPGFLSHPEQSLQAAFWLNLPYLHFSLLVPWRA